MASRRESRQARRWSSGWPRSRHFCARSTLFVPRTAVPGEPDAKEAVRLKLGRWLAVALELELGADILRTAVAPTWTEIGQLGAIVVLRTALNFFLQQEIDKAEARRIGGHLRIR